MRRGGHVGHGEQVALDSAGEGVSWAVSLFS